MPSDLQVDNIKDASATKTLAEYSSSAWSWGAGVPANTIINVTSLTRSSTDSHTNSTAKEISGLTHTISNPKSGSKFLITGVINLSFDNATAKGGMFITRTDADGEVTIAQGDTNGSRTRVTNYIYLNTENYSPFPLAFNFLDSPNTTSSVVYKFKFSSLDNTGVIYVNRSDIWGNEVTMATPISTTTVFEVAQ